MTQNETTIQHARCRQAKTRPKKEQYWRADMFRKFITAPLEKQKLVVDTVLSPITKDGRKYDDPTTLEFTGDQLFDMFHIGYNIIREKKELNALNMDMDAVIALHITKRLIKKKDIPGKIIGQGIHQRTETTVTTLEEGEHIGQFVLNECTKYRDLMNKRLFANDANLDIKGELRLYCNLYLGVMYKRLDGWAFDKFFAYIIINILRDAQIRAAEEILK